ncbi:MAG: 50S ribosomal protein L9 [Desulfobulbus propionicus]|nr:MAG: 50S ribosomal protein L9 [Desulfobulbus propionicus]
MDVILKETIDTLGQEGEIVKVKPGFARNFLIPQQKAVLVNKASLARLKQEQAAIAARLQEQQELTAKLMEHVNGKVVQIARKVGEEDRLFGSVTAADIAEVLEAKGCTVDRKTIKIAEPIKALGEYQVSVKVGYQAMAQITVQVIPESTGDTQ